MKSLRHTTTATWRRGSALVLALLVVMVLVGLGASFLLIANSASRRQAAETDNLRAFYLAEAGLAESFQALRIGRSGQLASEAEPAVHGDGLLWVDATDTVDDQVRLTSTALCGTGRASLALVVEPVDIPLGFFSDEDLVVDSVLLVDGFDSEEATYEEEIGELFRLRQYADWLISLVGEDTFNKHVGANKPNGALKLANKAKLGDREAARLASLYPDLHEAYVAGTLFPSPNPAFELDPIDYANLGEEDHDDEEDDDDDDAMTNWGMPPQGPFDPRDGNSPTAPSGIVPVGSLPTEYTDSGGRLSSNGDILFDLPSGQPVAILGDVIPSPEGSVESLGSIQVSGDTEPRSAAIELPQVDVPQIPMGHSVRHEDLLPLLIPPGESGHERIEVAADAELILRGPSTVVIGSLVLEPGALLTLDTRDGDVALYVTEGLDLRPGSAVTTSSDFPDELSIQVAEIPTGPEGAPVKLEATSQFHGTVFAPETEVVVGSEFEVYGSIVAQRLLLGPGAKLHFDNAEFDGSPIPEVVSWRIVEIPNGVRNRRTDPYSSLGVQRDALPALSEAHDLAGVDLKIEYLDHGGLPRLFDGREDQFNWTQVASVVSLEREALREPEQSTGEELPVVEPDDRPTGTREYITDAILNLRDAALKDYLILKSPLSDAEMIFAIDSSMETLFDPAMRSKDLRYVLDQQQPLPLTVWTRMLNAPQGLTDRDLKEILLHGSPLPPEVIPLVENAPLERLTPQQIDEILAAQ